MTLRHDIAQGCAHLTFIWTLTWLEKQMNSHCRTATVERRGKSGNRRCYSTGIQERSELDHHPNNNPFLQRRSLNAASTCAVQTWSRITVSVFFFCFFYSRALAYGEQKTNAQFLLIVHEIMDAWQPRLIRCLGNCQPPASK